MKRILHMFMTVLVLAAVMLMPVTDTLAAEGEANASSAPGVDYITVDGGVVTLHSDSMAGEGICSLQLTLTGAADFVFDETLAGGRMTHVSRTADGVTIYIAGASPLMADGFTTLALGTVAPADGTVTLAENSLIYVYGSRAIIRNVVDEEEEGDAEVQSDDPMEVPPETPPENQPPAERQPDSGFTDNNAGGIIGDGYDDGTGSGAPEPTATAEPTPIPTATPEPTTEPTATAAPTETPAVTSEPMTRAEDTAVPAATQQPAAAGTQAPATGDETVFVPWALTLILCGGLLAVIMVRGKRRQ